MGKEISFSDFLKEGALQSEVVAQTLEPKVSEKPVRIEPYAPATEKELRAFWRTLRHYFRTGERPAGVNGTLVPALIAPYLHQGHFTNDYPVFINETGEECVSLEQLIQTTFDASFADKEAKILHANLPRILKSFRHSIEKEKHYASFAKAWKVAEKDLEEVDVHGDKQQSFLDHLETLKSNLPKDGWVVRFSDEAPFVMLQAQLQYAGRQRKELLKDVQVQILAIQEMLEVESTRSSVNDVELRNKGFSFANEMIAFDKMDEMMPEEGTEGLTPERVTRLKAIVEMLENGKVEWAKQTAFIQITEALFDQFDWKDILEGAEINKAEVTAGYKMTEEKFDKKIQTFAHFIAAHRMADLELTDKYREDIHTDFFDHFTWHRLSDDELNYFPPVFFIGEAAGFLKNNLSRFSSLLAANKPIRLVAIDKRLVNAPNPDVDWEDASHGYRQELAALAFAHRSTHTFQCAVNQPVDVFKGMSYCLSVAAPSIMHLLIPDTNEIKMTEVLKLSAAVEGRFFPFIHYDLHKGNKWGSRFQIFANPQPEKDWPEYEFKYLDTGGAEQKEMLPFTYADYKAVTREKMEELFIVPEAYNTDDLIHIADYLKADVKDLTGKVPFIWLVDQDNRLKRAAMPYMWVVSCQERLDNWNYIQELGGVNSYHVKKALEDGRKKWDDEKANEINRLKTEYEDELEERRSNAAGEAMDRLANILLDLDSSPVGAPKAKTAAPKAKAVPKGEAEAEETEALEAEEELEISNEPWLETFKCTSCNECTDKYPTAFKYNEDKQAILTDPSSIKFADMVMAAEECPANCIHPGAPLNPDEPNLDEWIKKAAQYN